jgi:hypothetical protein
MLDYISKIIKIYVGLLVIFSSLATVGLVPKKAEPDVEVLKPIYAFNMTEIYNILKSIGFKDIDPSVIGTMSDFGLPSNSDSISSIPYRLPYELNSDSSYSGWSSWDSSNPWYMLGVSDTSLLIPTSFNSSACRTEDQKINGLLLMYTYDFLHLSKIYKLIPGCSLKINPLNIIKMYCEGNQGDRSRQIAQSAVSATRIYSIISINNRTSENIENVNVFINDVVNWGLISCVGWTEIEHIERIQSNSPSTRLKIDRIRAGQSIEIMFRGCRSIRMNDVLISTPYFSFPQKSSVIRIMMYSFAVLLFFITSDVLYGRYKVIIIQEFKTGFKKLSEKLSFLKNIVHIKKVLNKKSD